MRGDVKSWEVWLKGVGAAVIGGAASALTAAVAAPQMFPMTRGAMGALVRVSVVGAVVNAAAYLKRSPLPGE
jgi:hypothetical protein